ALRGVIQREFLKAHRREQARHDALCPSIFTIVPANRRPVVGRLLGQRLELQLHCEMPGSWHPLPDQRPYVLSDPARWIRELSPYLKILVATLKQVVPLVDPLLDVTAFEIQSRY